MKAARRRRKARRLTLFLALAALGAAVVLRGWFFSTPRLSPADRRADIEYLAQWATDYSPFVDLNERMKGLPNHEELRAGFVKLAEGAKDNTEFLQIAYCYAQLIGASGHFYISASFDRRWLRESRPAYWSRLFRQNCIVHPPFRVARKDDGHLTGTDYQQGGNLIPSGSRILKVNGMTCPAYLDHVRSNTWVRMAHGPTKNLDRRLLLVNEGGDFSGWRVEFQLPDGSVTSCDVPASRGSSPFRTGFIDPSSDNCVCLVLNQEVGYIRLKSVGPKHVWPDRSTIHLFLARTNPPFAKLIIDVRDNGGGCTEYLYDTLMKRFLREPVSYKHVTGVRRRFLEDHSQAFIDRHRGSVSIGANETSVLETPPPPEFDEGEWVFYEISRELKPENRYPFEGDVFVLVNDRTGSGADDFANAVKQTGMATLVGQDTHGSCAAYLGPVYVTLPRSGMEFRLEVDLLINPDGTYNEITGTPPDVRLPAADVPEDLTREAVLRDEWVRKIIDDL